MTPVEWLSARLPPVADAVEPERPGERPRTLADLFAGRVGLFASKTEEPLSENTGERFADYLEEKRRDGRL